MTTVIPNFQPGFRLVDGTALNALVTQVNVLTPGFSPLNTALATVGAGTLLAAALLGGVITRTGSSAAFTDTTSNGTLLDSALATNAITGFSRVIQIKNSTAFAETIAGGVGVTVSGRTVIPGNAVGTFLLTRTGTATYTLVGISAVVQGTFDQFAFNATADDGTTQTLTAAMVVGGNITYHISVGGTTPSLTLPLAADVDTALPDIRTGQSFLLRVINKNSGNTTIVTNTGWTLSGGTLVLATNTWKEFLVTKTGTATYTGVNVGTGTFV